MLVLITPTLTPGKFKGSLGKHRMVGISNFIDICRTNPTNPVDVLNLSGFFVLFGCVIQLIFWKIMNKMVMVLGPSFRDRKSLGIKQTQVKPNVNRDCLLELASHIQTAGKQIVWKMLLDPHHTKCRWDNAMWSLKTRDLNFLFRFDVTLHLLLGNEQLLRDTFTAAIGDLDMGTLCYLGIWKWYGADLILLLCF